MKPDRLATDVGLGRTPDIDAFAFKVIGPQRAVAATYGAIARRGRLGYPVEPPLNCTAMAGTFDHFSHRFDLVRPFGQCVNRWFAPGGYAVPYNAKLSGAPMRSGRAAEVKARPLECQVSRLLHAFA